MTNKPDVETEDQHTYEMTVELAVLESLGIKLYSNAAAVLSELVANAYDADADYVAIEWNTEDGGQVVVSDNGTGMTVDALNKRFLTAGYNKRAAEGVKSKKYERPFMGRKGIGKLSVFSIARTITVYSTTEDGPSNGLRIVIEHLEKAIEAREAYHPTPVDVPEEYAKKGTTLVLDRLKSRRVGLTVNALRKRLARRFATLGAPEDEKGRFEIKVDGTAITYEDRQDLKRLQFIWEFGEQTLPTGALPPNVGRFVLPKTIVGGNPAWKVRGWIGTAPRPDDLRDDEEAGSLKNVIVLARKRPIQESIVEKLDFSRIFSSYVTGQIEADFLDLDGDYEDIATSDRQRLLEDDERVIGLQEFLREAFTKASGLWSTERKKAGAKNILDSNPKLRVWVESRPAEQREPAEKLIGTIMGLPLDKDRETEDRPVLLQSGVLAFERLALNKVTSDLDDLSSLRAEDLLPILSTQSVYEGALWGDILRSRVQAIRRFQDLTDADEKERVLQEHLYENLWLLDPSWERATGSEHMEQRLNKIAPDTFPLDDKGDEITGRMDIRYAAIGGTHVLVELKRYGVKADIEELYEQGDKYFRAMDSVLSQQNVDQRDIEVIFVLGAPPKAKPPGRQTDREFVRHRLEPIHGRYVLYDELTAKAISQYEEYLKASKTIESLRDLLDSLLNQEGPQGLLAKPPQEEAGGAGATAT